MGNRLGNQRQKDAKVKEEKQKERTIRKEEKRREREKKSRERNRLKEHGSEWDIEVEESSHFTGGDSESCMFHSAENISVSPYLDSSTRSEFEQGAVSSSVLEVCASASRQPQVLSSQDFRDGFSLEACIPPDIARREGNTETSFSAVLPNDGHKTGSVKSKRNNSSVKSSSAYRTQYVTHTTPRSQHDASSMGSSSQISGTEEEYSTPLLSTPVYQREGRCHSPTDAAAKLHRANGAGAEFEEVTESIPTTSASSFQYHHFQNTIRCHRKDSQSGQNISEFRNLQKPESPQPQRRKLFPKMTSVQCKKASSDDSSSNPTTPVPQRRAAAFLEIFRSSNRGDRGNKFKHTEKCESIEQAAENIKASKTKDKVKSNPLWKTWERSSSKKIGKLSNVSIFGTTRRLVQMESEDDMQQKDNKEKKKVEKGSGKREELDIEGYTKREIGNKGGRALPYSTVAMFKDGPSPRAAGGVEGESSNRNNSPPTVRSAAFCIMKLEELEKAIENTIREKFPDTDPILLNDGSNEIEFRGSRSLPTTPYLSKKVYISQKINNTERENQEVVISNKGITRYCDEIFESSPSPVMSPVVLRRFGARTRHASISPKIQRAKTAALYSSPREMSRVEESFATKTVTKVPIYHAVSTQQPQTSIWASNPVKPLTAAQKSESKYDNVVDENYAEKADTSTATHSFRHGVADEDDSDATEEIVSCRVKGDHGCQKPEIVPTFSAVFGSVSPKLKRCLESNFDMPNEKKDTTASGDEMIQGRSEDEKFTKSRSNYTRTTGDTCILDPDISSETENAPNQRSLTEDKKKDSAFYPQKMFPSVQLSHDKDKRGPNECLSRQTVISVAKLNCSQTGAVASFPTSNTSSRPTPLSLSMHGETINKFHPADSVPCSTVCTHSIADAEVRSHSTGNPHVGGGAGIVPRVPDRRNIKSGAIFRPPAQQDIGKANGRKTNKSIVSPASARKHSTDHAVFGSTIAPPCLSHASIPGPETTNRENSHIAHAPGLLVNQGENAWNAKNENKTESLEDESLVQKPGFVQLTTNCNTHNTLVYSTDSAVVKTPCDKSGSVVISDAKKTTDTLSEHEQLNVDVFLSHPPANIVPCDDKYDVWHDEEQRERCFANSDQQPNDVIDSELEDDQNFVLHRLPVSQVISEMINVNKDKQQPLRHQPQQKRLQQRHHQSNPASPDHGIKLMRTLVAMVTPPSYEQPFLTLEEKTVRSRGSASEPPSPLNDSKRESDLQKLESNIHEFCCQEIQTDSYTTADKSVDIGRLSLSACPSVSKPGTRPVYSEGTKTTGVQIAENDDSDESEYLKIVLACKRKSSVDDQDAKGANLCKTGPKRVPPPSPTAMQKLLREFDEEGDDEAFEIREIESEMKHECEMKQFTDKIYKRLSDILGSNQSCAENDLDDDVFEADVGVLGTSRSAHELLSRLEDSRESLSSNDGAVSCFTKRSSAVPSEKPLAQAKVLTIETSSSLTTTTSSDSDVYEAPQARQALQSSAPSILGESKEAENVSARRGEPNVFVFPEIHTSMMNSDDARQRRSSREYHSDDDVATGRGIPDYYDDKPLWSRRQKAPGQFSANMMAIRRRERRERWLKKRRRNRTELVSTGSSDTGSDLYSHRGDASMRESHFENEEAEGMYFDSPRRSSGVFAIPKYSKPILPFFDKSQTQCRDNAAKFHIERHHASCHYREIDSGSNSDDDKYQQANDAKDRRKRHCFSHDKDNGGTNDFNLLISEQGYHGSNMAIPGIEETFNELMSVKNILEEMQDKTPTNEAVHLVPLTTENVKSIHDFYKDCYSGGNGRRSRMSATDRTESDLDIYSETRDDASSDSNMYADDEEDDDKCEPYATADDEPEIEGGSNKSPCDSKSSEAAHRCDHDESDTNFVVGCTFYNSNTYPSEVAAEFVSSAVSVSNARSTPESPSAAHFPQIVPNSDDEFWTGGSAIEESCKQLESVADAVSSTFQNAREQMHDIQHHLQALRRQMEVLQDDLICTSVTGTQDMSMGSTGK